MDTDMDAERYWIELENWMARVTTARNKIQSLADELKHARQLIKQRNDDITVLNAEIDRLRCLETEMTIAGSEMASHLSPEDGDIHPLAEKWNEALGAYVDATDVGISARAANELGIDLLPI